MISEYFIPSIEFEVVEFHQGQILELNGENNYNKLLLGYLALFSITLFLLLYLLFIGSYGQEVVGIIVIAIFLRAAYLFQDISEYDLKCRVLFHSTDILASYTKGGKLIRVFSSQRNKIAIQNFGNKLVFFRDDKYEKIFEMKIVNHELSNLAKLKNEIISILNLIPDNQSKELYVSANYNKSDSDNYLGMFINRIKLKDGYKYSVNEKDAIFLTSKSSFRLDLKKGNLTTEELILSDKVINLHGKGHFEYIMNYVPTSGRSTSYDVKIYHKKDIATIKNIFSFNCILPDRNRFLYKLKLEDEISIIVDHLNALRNK